MRARIVKADDARTETGHTARAAADAWDALATHASTEADNCRHGAEQAERTRRRWARSV